MQSRQLSVAVLRSGFLAATLILGYAAHGSRVEFIAMANGERLGGSEVCLYAAARDKGPVAAYLSSDDIRCLPADQIIDFPSGAWTFFLRHEDGWTSAHGSTLVQGTSAKPEDGYRSITVQMHRSGVITFQNVKPSADGFAAYVPMIETSSFGPAFFPLVPGEKQILVPAGYAFTLLRIRDGRPIGAGPLATTAVDDVADAVELLPAANDRSVIAWVGVATTSHEDLSKVAPPVVRLVDEEGNEHRPLFEPDTGVVFDGFVVYRNVPGGSATLHLAGKVWKPETMSIAQVPPGGLFVEKPLKARLAQRATVRWMLPAEAGGEQPSCKADTKVVSPGEWAVQLLVCESAARFDAAAAHALRGCRTEREEPVTARQSGSVTFDLPTAGRYVAALRSATSLLAYEPVEIFAARDVDIQLTPKLPTIFGRITAGGKPVQALVRFETGAAVSDSAGAYTAVLDADPLDNVVEIIPCDGSGTYEHIPKESIVGSRTYDIRIPANNLKITVLDALSGAAVPGASVGRGIFTTADDAREASPSDDFRTDDRGVVTLKRLEPGYFLRICAHADPGPAACAEPIELADDTDADVTIRVRRPQMQRGRIIAPTPIRAAIVYFVRNGIIIDETRAAEDGTFTFAGSEAADTVVVTALNLPLFVVPRARELVDGETRVEVPRGAVRNFTVAISDRMPRRSGWFTLLVGDRMVPLNALAAHLTRRGFSSYIEDGGPVGVPDILESGPLRVMAVLGSYPQPLSASDLFTLPQYFSIRDVRPVPADGMLIFDRN